MHKIILYGPPINENLWGGYGGGTGGYTRNMSVYLLEFQFEDLKVIPIFHTINGQYHFSILTFPIRLIIDIFKILKAFIKIKPDGIHCMAQYRRALPREFFLTLICKIIGIPFLYEIKAGAFINSYNQNSLIYKKSINFIIHNSKVILCEGKPYMEYIKMKFKRESFYFPNVIRDAEVLNISTEKLSLERLNILFVGYCYKDKGVFELVEACKLASQKGLNIQLTLIGAEHNEFKEYLDLMTRSNSLNIIRMGKIPHNEVINAFSSNDIYCYPTSHKGEGHNNTINEAMMMNMVIITTRIGFLGHILDDSSAYFLKEVTAQEICNVINEINEDRISAKLKAKKANYILNKNFRSSIAKEKIHNYYKQLIS